MIRRIEKRIYIEITKTAAMVSLMGKQTIAAVLYMKEILSTMNAQEKEINYINQLSD